jgi:hypothetical protein
MQLNERDDRREVQATNAPSCRSHMNIIQLCSSTNYNDILVNSLMMIHLEHVAALKGSDS